METAFDIIDNKNINNNNSGNIALPDFGALGNSSIKTDPALAEFGKGLSKSSSTGLGAGYDPTLDNRYQDPSLGYSPNINNENLYEQYQSKGEYWGNVLSGTWAISKAQFANVWENTFNLGLGSDNLNSEATKELSDVMQSIADKYPIYNSSQDTWWKNASNFVGETMPQLGFTLGTAAAIMSQEAALALLTAPLGGEGAVANIPLALRQAKTALDVGRAMKQAAQMLRLSNTLKLGTIASKAYGWGKFALTNHVAAVSEATVEGYDAKENMKRLMSSTEFNHMSKEQKDALAEKVGMKVMTDNYKLLLMTNIIPLAQWAPGVKNIVGSISGKLFGRGIQFAAAESAEMLALGSKTIAQKIASKAGLLLTPLSEGLEEYNQGVIREAVTGYYKDRYDDNKDNNVKALSDYYTGEFKDRMSNPEAQKEFMSGVFIGALGGAGSLAAKATQNIVASNNKWFREKVGFTGDKALQAKLDTVNESLSEHKENLGGFLNHIYNSTLDKNDSIQKGDIKTAKDLEDKQKIEFFKTLIKNGSDSLFIEALESAKSMSKEDFMDSFGIDKSTIDQDVMDKFDPGTYVEKITKGIKNYRKINSNIVSFINNNPAFTAINNDNFADAIQNGLSGKKQLYNFLGLKKSNDNILTKLASNQEDAVFMLSDILMGAVNKKERFDSIEESIREKVPFLSSVTTHEFFNDKVRTETISSYRSELKSILDIMSTSSDPLLNAINLGRMNELKAKISLLEKVEKEKSNFNNKTGDFAKSVKDGTVDLFNIVNVDNSNVKLEDGKGALGSQKKVRNERLKSLFQEYLDIEAKYSNQDKIQVNDIQETWSNIIDALEVYKENTELLDTYNKLLNPSAFANLTELISQVTEELDNDKKEKNDLNETLGGTIQSIEGILNSTITDDEKKKAILDLKDKFDILKDVISKKIFKADVLNDVETKVYDLFKPDIDTLVAELKVKEAELKAKQEVVLKRKAELEVTYNKINASTTEESLNEILADLINKLAANTITSDEYIDFENSINAKLKALKTTKEEGEDYIPEDYEFSDTPVQFDFDSSTNQVEDINNYKAMNIQKFFNYIIEFFSTEKPFSNKAVLNEVEINGVKRRLVGKLIKDELRFYSTQAQFDKAIEENKKVQSNNKTETPGFSKKRNYEYSDKSNEGLGLRMVVGYIDENKEFIEVSFNGKHNKFGLVGESALNDGSTVNEEDMFNPFSIYTHTNRLNNPSYEKHWIENYASALAKSYNKNNKGAEMKASNLLEAAQKAYVAKKNKHFDFLNLVMNNNHNGLVSLKMIGLGYASGSENINTNEFLASIKGSNVSLTSEGISISKGDFESTDQISGKPYLSVIIEKDGDMTTEFLPVYMPAVVSKSGSEILLDFNGKKSNPLQTLLNLLNSKSDVLTEEEYIKVETWYVAMFRPYRFDKDGKKSFIDLYKDGNTIGLTVDGKKLNVKNLDELRNVYLGFSKFGTQLSRIFYNINIELLTKNIQDIEVIGDSIIIGEPVSYKDFILTNSNVTNDLIQVTDESGNISFERSNINSYITFSPINKDAQDLSSVTQTVSDLKLGTNDMDVVLAYIYEKLKTPIMDRINYIEELKKAGNLGNVNLEIVSPEDFQKELGKDGIAFYSVDKDKIFLNKEKIDDMISKGSKRPIEVIMEEFVHQQTAKWIIKNENSDLVKQLKALHEFTRNNSDKIIELSGDNSEVKQLLEKYINNESLGIKSLLEFVANMVSHEGLIKASSKLNIEDKSLLQSVIDLIKQILNTIGVGTSLQDNVLALTKSVIAENNKVIETDPKEAKKADIESMSNEEISNFLETLKTDEINFRGEKTGGKIIPREILREEVPNSMSIGDRIFNSGKKGTITKKGKANNVTIAFDNGGTLEIIPAFSGGIYSLDKIQNVINSKSTTEPESNPALRDVESKFDNLVADKLNSDKSVFELENDFPTSFEGALPKTSYGKRFKVKKDGREIGSISLKLDKNGNWGISYVDINKNERRKGYAEQLYKDVNKALVKNNQGVLYSDSVWLEDESKTEKRKWILDGEELTEDEITELKKDIDTLIKLDENGRLVFKDAVKSDILPPQQLWEKLVNQGLAEKLSDGRYKFKESLLSKEQPTSNTATDIINRIPRPTNKPTNRNISLEALDFFSNNEININNASSKLKITSSIDADIAYILQDISENGSVNYSIFDLIDGKINFNKLMGILKETYENDFYKEYDAYRKDRLDTDELYEKFLKATKNKQNIKYLLYTINNFNDVINTWKDSSTLFKVKNNIVFDIDSEDFIISNFDDRTEESSETNRGKDGEFDKKTNEVSNIDPAIKALVNNLIQIKRVVNKGKDGEKFIIATNSYGRPKLLESGAAWSKILNNTHSALDYADMISKLEVAAETNPSLLRLISIAKDLIEPTQEMEISKGVVKGGIYKQLYATKLFQAFSGRVKVDSYLTLTTETEDGNKLYKRTIETESIFKRLLSKFSDNYIKISRGSSNSEYYTKAENKPSVLNLFKLLNEHPVFTDATKLSNVKSFFNVLGFNFSEKTFSEIFKEHNSDVVSFINFFKQDINDTLKKLSADKRLSEFVMMDPVNQIYNGIKDKTNKTLLDGQSTRLNVFLAVESKYTNEVPSLSVLNINNDKIYTMGVKNSMLQMLAIMNHPSINSVDDLAKVAGFEYLNNAYSADSLILKEMFNQKGRNPNFKITFGLLGGEKNETQDLSKQANSFTPAEWLSYNINNLLKYGNYEIMRAESSSSTFTFDIRNKSRINEVEHLLVQPNELKDGFSNAYITRFENYLNTELNRLKGSDEEVIVSYHKTGLFNFLNKKRFTELVESGITDENREEVRSLMENKLNKTFEDFKTTLIENRLTDNLLDIDLAKVLGYKTLHWEDGARIFFGNYLVSNIEQTKLFDGGLEYFGNFHKRAKGMISTGNIPIVDMWLSDSLNSDVINTFGYDVNEDKTVWGTHTKSAILSDFNSSTIGINYNDLYEGYIIAMNIDKSNPGELAKVTEKLNPYNNMKIADGQGYSTFDFYRSFRISVGNWDMDKDELGYRYLLALHRTENPNKAYTENPELYNKDLAIIEHAEKSELVFSFPPIKMQGRGFRKDGKPFFDKFSIAPLLPRAIKGSYMEELNNKMMASNIGYVKMESGTKLGFLEGKDYLDKNEFNKLIQDGILSTDGLDFVNKQHEIPNIYLKEQILTSNKIKEKNIFGTQFRKLILAAQFQDGKMVIPELGPKYADFINAITELSNIELNGLLKELGLEFNNDFFTVTNYQDFVKNITIKSKQLEEEISYYASVEDNDSMEIAINYKNLSEKLLDEAKQRAMNNNILDSLELQNGKFPLPLELNTNKQAISNLIRGMVNNRLIGQKINGAQLIQISALGLAKFSNTTKENIKKYQSTEQRFYVPIIENGKIVSVSKAQVKVGYSNSYKNLNNLDISAIKDILDITESKVTNRENLNKIIRTINQLRYNQYSQLRLTELEVKNKEKLLDWYKNNLEESLSITGYRIPTQGFNSMEALEIEEFLPEEVGNIIVPPAEIVAKSGSDFDIDKMSTILANIGEDGRYISEKNLNLELQNKLDTVNLILDKNELYNSKDFDGIENIKKDSINNLVSEITKELKYTEEEIEEILMDLSLAFDRIDEEIIKDKTKKKKKDKKTIIKEEILDLLSKFEDTKFKKKSIQNSIIKSSSDILLHPENFANLITPNSTDLVDDPINTLLDSLKLASLSSNEKEKNATKFNKTIAQLKKGFTGFDNILPQTNLVKYKVLFGLKELLGIAAVNNTFATIFHQNNFKINNEYSIDGLKNTIVNKLGDDKLNAVEGKISLSNSKNEFDQDIVEIISQMINIFVDSASDDRMGYLNIHKKNTGSLMYMLMRGYSFDKIMTMFNLPIVYQFENQDYKSNTYINKQKEEVVRSKSYTNVQFILNNLIKHNNQFAKMLIENLNSDLKNKKANVAVIQSEDGSIKLGEKIKNPYLILNYITNHLNKMDKSYSLNQLQAKIKPYNEINTYSAQNPNESLDDMILLSHYLRSMKEADQLRQVESRLNFDTSRHQSVSSSISQLLLEKTIEESGFVDKSEIDNIIENSTIKSFAVNDKFIRVHQLLMPLQFGGDFIVANLVAENVFRTKKQADFIANISNDEMENFNRTFTNDFIEAIVKTYGKVGDKNYNDYSIQLIKNNFFINTLDYLKNNPDSADLFERFSVLNRLELVKPSTLKEYEGYNNWTIIRAGEDSVENQNEYIKELEDLFALGKHYKDDLTSTESEKEIGKKLTQLILNMMYISFYQSGFNKSPISFTDLIPNSLLNHLLESSLKSYDSLSFKEKRDFLAIYITEFFNQNPKYNTKSAYRQTESYRGKNYNMSEKSGDQNIVDKLQDTKDNIFSNKINDEENLDNSENSGNLGELEAMNFEDKIDTSNFEIKNIKC